MLGLSCLHWLNSASYAIISLILSLFVLVLRHVFKQKIAPALGLVRALLFGLLWGSLSIVLWYTTSGNLIKEPQNMNIEGTICSLPSVKLQTGRGVNSSIDKNNSESSQNIYLVSFTFCADKLDTSPLSFYQNNRIKLNYYRVNDILAQQLTLGSKWRLLTKVKPIYGRLNPDGFDYEKWLVSEGYIGTGYIRQSEMLMQTTSIKQLYYQFRNQVITKLKGVIPDTEREGFIYALAVGERDNISREQWRSIQGSGTAHLLAISGLHIGIAAMWSYYFVFWIVSRIRWFCERFSAQRIGQVAALVGGTSISVISGLGYPAQRALIMLLVFLSIRWLGRNLNIANSLALAVIIISVLQPFSILSISFWLSVSAVSIIVLVVGYKELFWRTNNKLTAWLRVNWYLFVGLIPITWMSFDSISLVAFGANILLIPLTSFVTAPLIYIGMLVMAISENLAMSIFLLVDWLISVTYEIQLFFASFNRIFNVPAIAIMAFILLSTCLLLFLLPRKTPGKSITLPLLLVSFLIISGREFSPPFKMVVFDVGHGLAIHISVDNKHLLYDTGYGNSDYSVSNTSLIPYFRRLGIRELDAFVVSHDDADHSGGYRDIINNLDVKRIYAGEQLGADYSSRAENCHNSASWQWKNVKFEFVAHQSDRLRHGNNASCVLQLSIKNGFKENTIVITGDIEKRAEMSLLRQQPLKLYQSVDLLIAPHHGSLTSSSEELVKYLSPKLVVFSAAFKNQWNFPRPKVTKRYRDVGAKQLITWEQGAMTLSISESGDLQLVSERELRKHFWRLN